MLLTLYITRNFVIYKIEIPNDFHLSDTCKTILYAFISTAEVLLLDNEVAVFRSGTECKFYIAGPVEEVI